jgi:alanine-synthesizing transaminase
MFSSRLPPDLRPNRVTRAIERVRSGGRRIIDLTATNPTRAGFEYAQSLLQPLASTAALVYDPQPLGLPDARAAVCGEYARCGITLAPDQIVLTSSTSEAYSLLFKLLCGPEGESVMVPAPSYPLFQHLTALDGVRTIPYRLEYHGRWTLDVDSLDDAWSDSVRAVLAVSPNNPTGSVLSSSELHALSVRCADRNAALILDEVFADYPLSGARAESPRVAADPESCTADAGASTAGPASTPQDSTALTFRLGGLSKSAGLPQLKLGWMGVQGPEVLMRKALARLELICDTYLSVSTPVQIAARALIEAGAVIRPQICDRVCGNHRVLQRLAAAHPAIALLHADAGWSAVVRVPAAGGEEDLVVELVEEDGVLVHPGFLFDFPSEAFVVVSLLPEPSVFAEGVRRLLERADA